MVPTTTTTTSMVPTATTTTSMVPTTTTTTTTTTTSMVPTTTTITTSTVSTSDTTAVTATTDMETNTVISASATVAAGAGGSSDGGSSVGIIAGVVGGVILLLMITVVLCIVILCMRRCHRKGIFPVDNKVFYNTTELNENVTIDNNPAYDVTKANTVGSLYSTIKPGDSDVPITANPSYNVPTKPYSKAASEDEYVQLNQQSNLEDTIKMDTNPSYGVTTGGVSAHSDTKATTKQCDYDYVCEDRLLHQIAAASATGEAKKDIPASVDQSQYMENVHPVCIAVSAQPSSDGEHGVVNQPKIDDNY